MSDERITVFLTDDHQVVLEGIIGLVADDPGIQVIGTCNDGSEVLDKVQAAKPDVAVLDISLPGINGLDLCRMVKEKMPKTAVMMFTMHANEQCVLDALKNGASGYLIKESAGYEFCDAIHAVARGEIYLGKGVPRTVLDRLSVKEPDPYDTLTDRERHVLQLFAEGKSNRQITEMLFVSSGDVDANYANLMKKLKLTSMTDLVKFAIRKHIITVD